MDRLSTHKSEPRLAGTHLLGKSLRTILWVYGFAALLLALVSSALLGSYRLNLIDARLVERFGHWVFLDLETVLRIAVAPIALLWLCWIVRIGRAVSGKEGAESVVVYFIPVGNLILPLLDIRAMWRAVQLSAQHPPALLWIWWVNWLAFLLFPPWGAKYLWVFYSGRYGITEGGWLLVARCLLGATSAFLASIVVHRLTLMTVNSAIAPPDSLHEPGAGERRSRH